MVLKYTVENLDQKEFGFYIETLRARKLPTIHTVDPCLSFTGQPNARGRRLRWELHWEDGEPVEVDLGQADYTENPLNYLPFVMKSGFFWSLDLIPKRRRYGDNPIAGLYFDSESVYIHNLDHGEPPKNREQRELLKLVREQTGSRESLVKRSAYPDISRLLIEKMVDLWAEDGF